MPRPPRNRRAPLGSASRAVRGACGPERGRAKPASAATSPIGTSHPVPPLGLNSTFFTACGKNAAHLADMPGSSARSTAGRRSGESAKSCITVTSGRAPQKPINVSEVRLKNGVPTIRALWIHHGSATSVNTNANNAAPRSAAVPGERPRAGQRVKLVRAAERAASIASTGTATSVSGRTDLREPRDQPRRHDAGAIARDQVERPCDQRRARQDTELL